VFSFSRSLSVTHSGFADAGSDDTESDLSRLAALVHRRSYVVLSRAKAGGSFETLEEVSRLQFCLFKIRQSLTGDRRKFSDLLHGT
jgi:hypothetical protein